MEKIWDLSSDFVINLALTLLIILLGLVAVGIIVRIFRKAMKKANMDPSLVSFFVRCIRAASYIIITISALSKLGISTTGIIAGFSAAAAALALALKDSLSDIASGIVILFTKPFVTGDFIDIGEHMGFVQKIDMLHTNILTYDDTNVIIPNSKITSSQVNNHTAHPSVRVQIVLPLSYETDFDKAKEIILNTIMSTDKVILNDEKHKPAVRLEHYLDSSLETMVRCWTEFENYWTVYYSLTENIKKNLEKEGIFIPFNQLDVHIIGKE